MGKKVLIVDDETLNRELLAGCLAKEGYDLLEAVNVREAREVLDRDNPDLVLLDIVMPGEDGFTLCKEIKAKYREPFLPVILVTALADRESRLTGLDSGADDFLTKPVDRIELSIKVRNMLKIRELHLSLYNELVFAQRVQENLFFANNSLQPGDKMFYRPCRRVGGDLIEVWEKEDARWALLADASGHGPSAALIAAAVKALNDKTCASPSVFLEQLNAKLFSLFSSDESACFVTAVCLKIEDNRLEFAGAGHPPVFLKAGEEIRQFVSSAMPLGIWPAQFFLQEEAFVETGQLVFLYSDGLLNMLSEAQIRQSISSGADGEGIHKELAKTVEQANPTDDISFLVLAI